MVVKEKRFGFWRDFDRDQAEPAAPGVTLPVPGKEKPDFEFLAICEVKFHLRAALIRALFFFWQLGQGRGGLKGDDSFI